MSIVPKAILYCLLTAPAFAVLGEPVAVVVPAGSAHRIDSALQLAQVYRKKVQRWPDGQRIDAINLPAQDPLRRSFSQVVLGVLPEQLDAFWNEMYFQGVLPPKVLNSPEAVLRYIAATPAAVGYVPSCRVDRRVVVVFTFEVVSQSCTR